MKSMIVIAGILSAGAGACAAPEPSAKAARTPKGASACSVSADYLPTARPPSTAAQAGLQSRAGAAGMPGNNVDSRVRNLLAEHLGVAAARLRNKTRLVDDLCADSLDLVELVIAAEEEFGIEITDDAAGRITTVGDLVSYVRKQTGKAAS